MKSIFKTSVVLTLSLMMIVMQFGANPVKAEQAQINGITVSGKHSGSNEPGLVLDGDDATYWKSPSASSMDDHVRYLQFDLKGLYDVSKIELLNAKGSYYHYQIYTSVDGEKFDKVAYKTDDTMADGYETHNINKQARFVRVNITFNSKEQAVNIHEIKFYGSLVNKDDFVPATIEVADFKDTKWGPEFQKFKDDAAYAKEKTEAELLNLVGRVLGDKYRKDFKFEVKEDMEDDYFEVSSVDGVVLIKGNNGGSLASGFNYYIKNYAKLNYNPLFGSNVDVKGDLPKEFESVIKMTDFTYRYSLNFVTFSYTMSFWAWDEYQEFLDWSAMNGINLMLDIVGQEEVLRQVLGEYGYSDQEVKEYLTGPAYFGWFYMQNMYGYGGPLPSNWFEQRTELSRQIHDRMQVFGIEPVMQAFSGQVPLDFQEKNPKAIAVNPGGWPGYQRPYLIKTYLNEADKAAGFEDYFDKVADTFYETQQRLYGDITDYYATDPFHEGGDVAGSGLDIVSVYREVQRKIMDNDEAGIWVLQQWQWNVTDQKLQGLINPQQVLVLDLQSDLNSQTSPMEKYDTPWVWNMLHNFGGRMGLDGEPETIATNIARDKNKSKNMKGIGITPEAINNSGIVYDLMGDMTWEQDAVDYIAWTENYIQSRYGGENENLSKAWEILLETAYSQKGQYYQGASESYINAKPNTNINAASTWGHSRIMYDAEAMEQALPYFIAEYDNLKHNEAFMHDFVDVTKQVIANAVPEYHRYMMEAYNAKDLVNFKLLSGKMLEMIRLQDDILGTSQTFLLGPWIESSRTMLEDQDDWTKDLFEMNARSLLTTWGAEKNAKGGGLDDYSNRQWAGLTKDYYLPRWEKWIGDRVAHLEYGTPIPSYDWFKYGWEWVNTKSDETYSFTTEVSGKDLSVLAQTAYDMYSITNMDPSLKDGVSDRINLALNKTVTTNKATAPGSAIEKIVDGSNEIGWQAAEGVKDAVIEIDLEDLSEVDGMEFMLQQIANKFAMKFSVDVFDGTEWKVGVFESATDGLLSKTVVDYRGVISKVRFNVASTNGTDLIDIKEINVFGVKAIAPHYENLALGGSVQVQSFDKPHENGDKLIDGNDTTLWVAQGGQKPTWAIVNLPKAEYVDKAVVKFEQNADRSTIYTVKAILEDDTEELIYTRPASENRVPHDIVNEIAVNRTIKGIRVDIQNAFVPSSGGPAWALMAEIELLQLQEREVKTENIAPGKTITASKPSQAGRDPKNAIDGNESTLWVGNGGVTPINLTLDFGVNTAVSTGELVFEQAGRTFKVDIVGIKDNGDEVVLRSIDGSQGTPLAASYTFDINSSIRYVEVRFLKSAGTAWPAVAELRVFSKVENIAMDAVIESTLENADLINDDNLDSGVSVNAQGNTIFTFDFENAVDLSEFETYVPSSQTEPIQFYVEAKDDNGNYNTVFTNIANANSTPRVLYSLDKVVLSDSIRFVILNKSFNLNEIKMYKSVQAGSLSKQIATIEAKLKKITVGELSGQYAKVAHDALVSVLEASKELIDSGANSKMMRDQEVILQSAYKEFLKTGFVVVDRIALTGAVRDANILAKELDNATLNAQLDAAISAATKVLKTSPMKQVTLDDAVIALQSVMDEVFNTLEKQEQAKVIIAIAEALIADTSVGNKETQVPQAAVDTLTVAINTAKESLVDGVLSDEAIATLQSAIEDFKNAVVKIDKSQLEALIATGDALDLNNYDADTVVAYKAALAIAQNVMTSHVSVEDYTASLETLSTALENLRVLNKESLAATLAAANAIKEGIYTDSTYKALQVAIRQAQDVIDKNVLKQLEIDAAQATLQGALDKLIIKTDTSEIEALIAKVEAILKDEAKYTASSWTNMINALNNAKSVLESEDQGLINQALATLQDTFDNLKEIPDVVLDFTQLDERIEIYSKLDFKLYTQESVALLKALIEEAKILSGNNSEASQIITQDDIDMLVEKMDRAYKALELKDVEEPEVPLVPLEPSKPGKPETGLPGTGVSSTYGMGIPVLIIGFAIVIIGKMKRKEFE